jgi:hypothetical protein
MSAIIQIIVIEYGRRIAVATVPDIDTKMGYGFEGVDLRPPPAVGYADDATGMATSKEGAAILGRRSEISARATMLPEALPKNVAILRAQHPRPEINLSKLLKFFLT